MAISDYLGNMSLGDLVGGGAALYGLSRQGNQLESALNPTGYDQQYQQLSNQLQQLTGQLADSSNPEFQRRVQQRTDEIMREYENSLRQNIALEGRRQARGLPGTINPEGRDALLSGQMARFKSEAESKARAEVANELVQAARVGTNAAGVSGTGVANERQRRVAQANVGNSYDAARMNALMQIFKPLLGSVNIGKVADAVFGGGGGASASPTIPEFGGGDFNISDPGYMSPLQSWGSASMPTAPSAPNLSSFDSTGFGGDLSGWDMNLGFPDFGGDQAGVLDPGYGYAAPANNFQFPTIEEFGGNDFTFSDPGYGYTPSFATPEFDMPNWDFGGDWGLAPDFGAW